MTLCCSIFDIQRVRYGFGRHVEYVQPTLTKASMYDVLEELINVIITLFIKLSVCLLIRRIIRATHPKVNMILWIMIVFLMIVAFTTCVLFSVQCKPFRKIWDFEVPGVCLTHLNLGLLVRGMAGESPGHVMPCVRPVLIWRRKFWEQRLTVPASSFQSSL